MLGLHVSKRLRFLAVSGTLAGLLAFISLSPYAGGIAFLFFPPLVALFLAYLVLGRPGGIESITLLLLPTALTLGAALSQFFFPNLHFLIKLGGWIFFGIVFYVLLLTVNIFRVERLKREKILLERAARPTVFFLFFLTAFLLLTSFYKLELGVLWGPPGVFLIGFLLALNFFWFLTLSDLFERRFFLGAAVVGGGLVQVSLAFSFLPWEVFLRGLAEGVFFYAILGVARAYFERHLRYQVVFEYILLSLVVFLFTRAF